RDGSSASSALATLLTAQAIHKTLVHLVMTASSKSIAERLPPTVGTSRRWHVIQRCSEFEYMVLSAKQTVQNRCAPARGGAMPPSHPRPEVPT
ncbi:MAG: hypothetical protein OEM62_10400, partial [Acidobacteriota bacterium]|nr:hypothetical protein [Acidobacteriota bacterium]